MARRRFQFSDGQSSKFWEIQLKGKSFAVRYGKLGSAGQTLEKQFASPQDAKEAFDKLIREKLKKGYRECTGADPEPSASGATAAKKAPAAGQARRTGKRILCEAIYREAERLGANTHGKRELPKSVKRCPELVAEFYQNIIWPKRLVFQAEIDEREFVIVSFYGPVQEFDVEELGVVGCSGMDLFGIGMHNGGNWILLVDGNDKRKSDPTVYEVDHAPEPGDELNSYGRLSKFLQELQSPA